MSLETVDTYQSFSSHCGTFGIEMRRGPVEILQVNLGKLCNQSCSHCHVGAGPNKTRENMSRETAEAVVDLALRSPTLKTVDLTGGAPEMNPWFRFLVTKFRDMGLEVVDRCNLSVLFEPGQEATAEFLAENRVRIIASLPCYSSDNVDRQRGDGVFEKSIRGLQKLNALGYGGTGSGLVLDLVYNPGGAILPPRQLLLQEKYEKILFDDYGIRFNSLYCMANMPIKRFRADLKRQGQERAYEDLLRKNFNQHAAQGVMCRSLVSVSWDGRLFDCDFNQMLNLSISGGVTITSISSLSELRGRPIVTADHCFACTAGEGSSCSGALA